MTKKMGRPVMDPDQRMFKRSITLENKQQADKLTELGGSFWIRKQIDKA